MDRMQSQIVDFPSIAFFEALQRLMREDCARFERLGYFDATIGVRVLDGRGRKEYALSFEVFDCVDVEEADLTRRQVDFTLEAGLDVWLEMLANIREHGAADAEHGINTLTHFGERMRSIYDDPDAHDKQFRFAESIQAFFDLAAKLQIRAASPATAQAASA
jgi:hypothetical protein